MNSIIFFFYFINIYGFIDKLNKCHNCKYYIPPTYYEKLKDKLFGKIIVNNNQINSLFGRCRHFKNEKREKNNIFKSSINKLVIECRFNETLCGLIGKEYKERK